jgi:hypothetical protein
VVLCSLNRFSHDSLWVHVPSTLFTLSYTKPYIRVKPCTHIRTNLMRYMICNNVVRYLYHKQTSITVFVRHFRSALIRIFCMDGVRRAVINFTQQNCYFELYWCAMAIKWEFTTVFLNSNRTMFAFVFEYAVQTYETNVHDWCMCTLCSCSNVCTRLYAMFLYYYYAFWVLVRHQ